MPPPIPSYVVRGEDGEEYGPVDLVELREWVQENRAGLGTEVKRDEPNAIWEPWQHFPELVALLAEMDATGDMLGLVIAPMWRRILAFAIDLILGYVLFIPIMVVLAFAFLPDWLVQSAVAYYRTPYIQPELSSGTQMLIQSSLDWMLVFYFCFFVYRHGQTPGLTLLRLRVVNAAGQKPGIIPSFARAIVLAFSILLLFLPMTVAFFNPQRRALHDMVAGTYVVEA